MNKLVYYIIKVAYPSFYIQNVYANGMLALKNDEIDTLFSNRIHYTKRRNASGKTCIVV